MDGIELEVKLEEAQRARWLALRLNHLTGTDLAKIMAGKEMEVWLDKKQQSTRGEAPEYFYWGNKLQPKILEGYADKVGQPIEHADPYDLIENPHQPLFSVSLDARWTQGDKRCVDAKNVGYMDAMVWGPPGSTLIPDAYYVQLQMQMAATDTPFADLAALFGGRKLAVYTIERDQALIDDLYNIGLAWWQKHIVGDTTPPVEGTDTWLKYLASRRQTSNQVVEATEADVPWVVQLREARLTGTQAEALEKEARAHLELSIGEHAGMAGPGFKLSFRKSTDSNKVDWQKVAEQLVDALVEAAEEKWGSVQARESASTEYRTIVEAHTKIVPGTRRFLPTFKEQ